MNVFQTFENDKAELINVIKKKICFSHLKKIFCIDDDQYNIKVFFYNKYIIINS